MALIILSLLASLFFILTGRWTILYLIALLTFVLGGALSYWVIGTDHTLPLLAVGLAVCLVSTFLLVSFTRWVLPLFLGLLLPLFGLLLSMAGVTGMRGWPLLAAYAAGVILAFLWPRAFSALFSCVLAAPAFFSLSGLFGVSGRFGLPALALVILAGVVWQSLALPRGEKQSAGDEKNWLRPFYLRLSPGRREARLAPEKRFPRRWRQLAALVFFPAVIFLVFHAALVLLTPVLPVPDREPFRGRGVRLQTVVSGGLVIGADNVFYLTGRETPLRLVSAGAGQQQRLRLLLGGVSLLDRRILTWRRIKEPEEITAITRACRITVEALTDSLPLVAPGETEKNLAEAIEAAMRRRGADPKAAFPAIVAGGRNALILHYDRYRDPLRSGELAIIDIGCQVNGYASDLTRTLPVSGKFSPEQLRLYRAVLGAQQAALKMARPGVSLRRLHQTAVDFLKKRDLNLYFRHFISHHVGLDVHDPVALDSDTPLVPGMVVTIEPGVYIPARGVGIRIEDTILITADGFRNLTAGFPKEPEEIEKLLSK